VEHKAQKLIEILGLKPLNDEGGFFRQTYCSADFVAQQHLPEGYKTTRAFSTAIYYLITAHTLSKMHRLPADEVFHFYDGDPVEMLQLYEDGSGKLINIGNDIENGLYPQVIVSKKTWQGTRLIPGGTYALLGTTMSPGFEYEDLIMANKAYLLQTYPEFAEMINRLT
jgi:predicted cupin superfamily sugar epimerase